MGYKNMALELVHANALCLDQPIKHGQDISDCNAVKLTTQCICQRKHSVHVLDTEGCEMPALTTSRSH